MFRRKCLRAALVCALLVLAATVVTQTPFASAAWWDEVSSVDGNVYTYTLFSSSTDPNLFTMRDGASGVGRMGFPSYVGAVIRKNTIAVCDMLGSGSAIRVIDEEGITTLAGNRTQQGYVDGPGPSALFRGVNSGEDRLNGLSFIGGHIYLADRDNNAIRVITVDGTTSTMINGNAIVENLNLSAPVFVASFADNNVTLFISDSGNRRILTATQQGQQTPMLTVLLTDRATGPLVYSTERSVLYYTYSASPMALGAVNTSSVQTTWDVGNKNTLGYINSLVLSQDQKELLYYGNSDDNVVGVYSIRVDTNASEAPDQLPTLKFAWPPSALSGAGAIRSIMPHSDTSYYIVTGTSVYVVSTTGPLPDQSDSSSGSPFANREHGIAAYPRYAFPYNDTCLMSQLYYYIRMDVAEAFGTEDYYTQFAPIDDPSMAIMGDVNVSSWCGNISSRYSNDETITILDFWGPQGWTLLATQEALANSPWTNTREFLANLNASGWDDLWPFCFYNCMDKCETETARKELCVDYVKPQGESKCDGVCKGAIISSVVMGCAGAVLLVLMAVNPANVFTALILVPLI